MCCMDFQRIALCEQAGGSPAARHFSLLRQRKVTKRKATLLSATLRCATGTLRCSVQPGSRANSPAAQTSTSPDPSGLPLLGASKRGLETNNPNTKFQKPQVRAMAGTCFGIGFRYPHSCLSRPGWACAAQGKRDQGRALFEPQASLRGPPLSLSSAGCPKRSEGTQTAGRFFFGYFLLAKQKKVTSRRATPGLRPQKNRPHPKQREANK